MGGLMTAKYAYKEIERARTVPKCLELNDAGRPWHIHSLAPGCRFSHRPELHCFVIEDTQSGEVWCAFSEQHFKAECKQLVQVLHGAEILDVAAKPGDFVAPPTLEIAQICNASGEAWHHHMMKPGCILSPAPEQHVITLERASSQDMEIHASDTPPDDVLREIELLYFGSD